jgi:hypothetical protein
MRYAIGIGLLVIIVAGVASAARQFIRKRRKVRLRGTADRGRIDIRLAEPKS